MEFFRETLTHKPDTDNSEWNESYYFLFGNKELNLYLMTRMGFKPNKKEAHNFMFIFLPDGTVVAHNKIITIDNYTIPFTVGNMVFEPKNDGTWHYSFKDKLPIIKKTNAVFEAKNDTSLIKEIAQIDLDLVFKPIHDTYEYSEYMTRESLEIGKKSGNKHWEQIASINGTLQVGDKTYKLNDEETIGERDHTYGLREWTNIGNWLYYVVWFDKNFCVNPAVIVTDDGRLSTGGFIFKDGKNLPIKTIEILDEQFEENEIIPVGSILKLTDFEGNSYILKAKTNPGSAIPLPFKDGEEISYLIQSVGSFSITTNNIHIKDGFGSYEVLRKASKIKNDESEC